jgi:hypothetical protein
LKYLEKGLSEESVAIKREREYAASIVKHEPDAEKDPVTRPLTAQPLTVSTDSEGMPIVVPNEIARYFADAELAGSSTSPAPAASPSNTSPFDAAASSFMSDADKLIFELAAAVPFAPPGHQEIAARASGKQKGSPTPMEDASPVKKGRVSTAAKVAATPMKVAGARQAASPKRAPRKKASQKKASPKQAASMKKETAAKGASASQNAENQPLKMSRKNVLSRAYHGKLNECLKHGWTIEHCKEAARMSYQQAKERFDQ